MEWKSLFLRSPNGERFLCAAVGETGASSCAGVEAAGASAGASLACAAGAATSSTALGSSAAGTGAGSVATSADICWTTAGGVSGVCRTRAGVGVTHGARVWDFECAGVNRELLEREQDEE